MKYNKTPCRFLKVPIISGPVKLFFIQDLRFKRFENYTAISYQLKKPNGLGVRARSTCLFIIHGLGILLEKSWLVVWGIV